jgi:Transcription- and export-related complex subunit
VVPATDALRYLTRLSLDAATYCCVTRLSANRQLYDGQNSGPADWLKNLSDCIGNIYKKVSSASTSDASDCSALLQCYALFH